MKFNDMPRRLSTALMAAVMAVAIVPLAGCVKVVKTGQEAELTGQKAFDAEGTVDELWEDKVIPELTEEAISLSQLLGEANGKLDSVSSKYAKGSEGKVYVVKGTAKVVKQDNSKQGTLTVTLDEYTGTEPIQIQVGPIYKGTAVRDSLSFISSQDVKNQVEWANLSKSLNDKLAEEVVEPATSTGSLEGKTIEFIGCLPIASSSILITPVQLSIK